MLPRAVLDENARGLQAAVREITDAGCDSVGWALNTWLPRGSSVSSSILPLWHEAALDLVLPAQVLSSCSEAAPLTAWPGAHEWILASKRRARAHATAGGSNVPGVRSGAEEAGPRRGRLSGPFSYGSGIPQAPEPWQMRWRGRRLLAAWHALWQADPSEAGWPPVFYSLYCDRLLLTYQEKIRSRSRILRAYRGAEQA